MSEVILFYNVYEMLYIISEIHIKDGINYKLYFCRDLCDVTNCQLLGRRRVMKINNNAGGKHKLGLMHAVTGGL